MSLYRIVFTLEEYMFFSQNGGKQHSFPEHAEGTINRFKEQVEATGNSIVGTHREQDTQRWELEDDDMTMKGWN